MRKKIDILWLVEHVARELDVACAAKCIIEENFGLNVIVGNIYQHAKEFMLQYVPEIVVYPFFYRSAGALAIEDYVKTFRKFGIFLKEDPPISPTKLKQSPTLQGRKTKTYS